MKRGSSWLPRFTAKRPARFIASIFFLLQTSTDKPRPRQWCCACSPKKRAVVTDGGSFTRSRARNTPGRVCSTVRTERCKDGVRLRPGLNNVRLFRSEEHTSELQSLRHLVCRLL